MRLDVEDDPLLPGLHQSANSLVGDTLILGDESRREFLSVFAAELDVSTAEAAAIERFFADFAWRVTVLVQRGAGAGMLRQVRRLVELEARPTSTPTVVSASHPLVVGLRALVGVDTYPGRAPAPEPIRLDHSRVGVRDVLRTRPASTPDSKEAAIERPRRRPDRQRTREETAASSLASGVLLDAGLRRRAAVPRPARPGAPYLAGFGTVAGLAVEHREGGARRPTPKGLRVALASRSTGSGRHDRAPAWYCLRLRRAVVGRDGRRARRHPNTAGRSAPPGWCRADWPFGAPGAASGVVADVYLRFVTCERRRTRRSPGRGRRDRRHRAVAARRRLRAVARGPRGRRARPDPQPVRDVERRHRRRRPARAGHQAIIGSWSEGTDAWATTPTPEPLPSPPGADPTGSSWPA
ncbi:MAG: hypothetical protein R3F65_18125 [bacterium]